jgi:hypothetical protein
LVPLLFELVPLLFLLVPLLDELDERQEATGVGARDRELALAEFESHAELWAGPAVHLVRFYRSKWIAYSSAHQHSDTAEWLTTMPCG